MPKYVLTDQSQTETINLMVGGAIMPIQEPEIAVSIELALDALKYYFDNQKLPEHLNWEEL